MLFAGIKKTIDEYFNVVEINPSQQMNRNENVALFKIKKKF